MFRNIPDFGILKGPQNSPPPISQVDAETQPENYRANLSADTARLGILAQANSAAQENATNRQRNQMQYNVDLKRFGLDEAERLQTMRFAEESNPANQSNLAISAAKNKQDWDTHNQAMNVYNTVKAQTGDISKAQDAQIAAIAAVSPEHALQLNKDRAAYNQQLKENNYTNLGQAGDALYYANQHAEADGSTLYDLVKSTPSLRQMYPEIPDPKNYKNAAEYSNAVSVMFAGSHVAKQAMTYNFEVAKADHQSQLDTVRDAAKAKVTAAVAPESLSGAIAQRDAWAAEIAKLDPKSPRAQELQQNINMANADIANKHSASVSTAAKSALGVIPSINSGSNIINNLTNYTNGNNPPAQPQVPSQAQQPKQQFISGQVYQDASGNKAMFNNGQWVPQ